jgi:copper chaperone
MEGGKQMKKRSAVLMLIAALALSLSSAAAESSAKTILAIKGMTCGGCVAAVKVQLKRTEGVTAYDVSLEKGEAEVTYDPAKTEPKKIAESVSKTGFQATVKESKAPPKTSSIVQAPSTAAQEPRLEPWEPVDAAFTGCSEGMCGKRGRDARAVAQPGARVGEVVYCPVSGAVFVVKDSSPRAEVDGKTLYVCCDGCARFFAQNRARVLALREPSL